MTLIKELKRHISVSRNDRNVANAMNSLAALLFNILNCKSIYPPPFANKMYFSDGYMVNFKDTNKYPQKEIDSLKSLMKAYLAEVAAQPLFADILSDIVAENLDGSLGQFLTPCDVANACVELQMAIGRTQIEEQVAKGEITRIGDDMGCGAGSLLLAHLRGIAQIPNALPLIQVTAMDLDEMMCKLTTVQIMFSMMAHGQFVNTFDCFCGNTITQYNDADTLMFSYGTRVHDMFVAFNNLQNLRNKAA